jgi:hypothetical protein
LFENALKLTFGNVEFKKISGEDPRTPRSKGREREGGKSGRGVGRGGEGEERGGEGKGRYRKGRVEGKGLRIGKGRKEEKKEEGKGRGIWTPQCSRQIDVT